MMGDGYENGIHVQTVEPDIAGEIDERNGWHEAYQPKNLTIEESLASRAEAMGWFLRECWLPESHSEKRRKCREAAVRFTALSVLLRPDLFGSKGASYQSLAKELECSRAELSKVALQFSDKADLQFRGQRNKTTRAKNARARIKHHNKIREHNRGLIKAFAGMFSEALARARSGNPIQSA